MAFNSGAMIVFKNNRRWSRKTVAFSDWKSPQAPQANVSDIQCPTKSAAFQQRMKTAQTRGWLKEAKMYALALGIILFASVLLMIFG